AAEIEISKNVEPVIHGNYDDVARASEVVAVERMRRAGASGEAAAVQPYHHRPLAAHGRSEHVHHETILAFKCGRAMTHDQRVGRAAKLRRGRTILESVAYARPRLRFARRHETIAARG